MKLKEIYEIIVQEGIKEDLRTKEQVRRCLSEKRKEYRKLSPTVKEFFDKECLWNPYADTRILYGDPNMEVRRILVGIDIEVAELLVADQMSAASGGVDLVMAHHPEGAALAGLYDVMHLQTDILQNLGIREDVAKKMMKKRISEVGRRLHSANHSRTVDAARLLNMPLMCCHTPADNHVAGYLQKLMDRRKPKILNDVVALLMKEPEYQYASTMKAGPEILVGASKDPVGKVLVDMTGGTEGSKDIFARLSQAGIDTLLGMHYSEDHFNRIKEEYIHVVNAGHIASDNLGMNLLLDKIERSAQKSRSGRLEVIECSGFRRFRR